MVSVAQKTYLRGRAANVKSWQQRQREEQERLEAIRVRETLATFSEQLRAYAVTPDGQAAIEAARNKEYDEQWAMHLLAGGITRTEAYRYGTPSFVGLGRKRA